MAMGICPKKPRQRLQPFGSSQTVSTKTVSSTQEAMMDREWHYLSEQMHRRSVQGIRGTWCGSCALNASWQT
jgi:hypothetical protein